MTSLLPRSNALKSTSSARISGRNGAVVAAATAVLIGFTGMAVPAHAATAAPSAVADVTTSTEQLLPRVVVPTGGSATIALPSLPAGTRSVTIAFQGVGAWRDTTVTAAVGPDGARIFATTAKLNDRTVRTATLPVPANNNGQLTMWSSSASVEMRQKIVAITTSTTPVVTTKPAIPVAVVSSGAPNADNTGVPAGTSLRVFEGDIKVTEAGTVIDGLDVRGRIYVNAPNVTIKNSVVRGPAGGFTGSGALIVTTGGFAGTVISDTELAPTAKTPYVMGIVGNNFRATRIEIRDVIDSIHGTGSNITIQSSWLHDNSHFLNDPNHGGTPSHDDSIQIQAGNNIVIDGNTISGAFNAALQITQDAGIVSNLRFTNNSANGGGCTVNVAEKGRGAIQGIVISDNKFGRDTRVSNCAVISPTTTSIAMARNFYVPDNTPVTVRRGS